MKYFFRLLFTWFGILMAELLILYSCGATHFPWYCKIALVFVPAVIAFFLEDD